MPFRHINFKIGDKKSKLGVDKGADLYYYDVNLNDTVSYEFASTRWKGALRNQQATS
jgi:hypothetical protein